MQQMMKQMGIDVEEIEADSVQVNIGDKTLTFSNPELSKMKIQGKEVFQLQGEYEESDSGPTDEDIELVVEKTGCSREEAKTALEDSGDVASAVISVQN